MTFRITSSLFSVGLAVAVFFPTFASAAACAQDGGKMHCTELVVKSDWDFKYCGETDWVGRQRLWCERRGGVWDTSGEVNVCAGNPRAVTEDTVFGDINVVETEYHGYPCTLESVPSGWGVTVPSSNCWSGGTTTKAGLENKQLQTVDISSWSYSNGSCTPPPQPGYRYVLKREREIGCPEGFTEGVSAGREVCMKPLPYDSEPDDEDSPEREPELGDPEDDPEGSGGDDPGDGVDPESCKAGKDHSYSPDQSRLGNPFDISDGAKYLVERDYRSASRGGLEFKRFYNSTGYFSLTAGGVQIYQDYWRHSYSWRVVEFPANAYVMAAVQSADGVVRYFSNAGDDFHNVGPGRSKLERLMSGATHTGWRQTMKSGDVRLYDAQGGLTSVTKRSGFVHTLSYNGDGRLETVADSFGRSITLSYDVLGRLSRMTDPTARITDYTYDTDGRLSTVKRSDTTLRTYVYEDAKWKWALTGVYDERGTRLTTYTYSQLDGRLASTERSGPENRYSSVYTDGATTLSRTVTDAFGVAHTYGYALINGVARMTSHVSTRGTTSATYDANGNIASRTDRRGNVTTYVFDPVRNLETSRTLASGTALARTIATTWHPTLNLVTQTTRPSGIAGVNLVTDYTYDATGNLTRYRLTAGSQVREWTFTVNSLGQPLTVDGPRTDVNDVTTFTYFSSGDPCVACRGQVATITNPVGQVTTVTSYNQDGKPLSITDANGVVTAYSYNGRGWLAGITVANETTSYEWDVAGNLKKITFPDASWVQYSYDQANGILGIDDSAGNAIDYELDVKGNMVRTDIYDPQNQLKRTLQRIYDNTNRLSKVIGAAGQEHVFQWDGNSNVTSITDPLFNATGRAFDALDRLMWSRDAANNYTYFYYDAKDRLTSVKDPRNLTTTYTFDGLGNRTQLASPDAGSSTYTHDAAGNVVTATDARGVVTTYTHDALNRVVSASVTDGTVTYEYDNTVTGGPHAKGRLTKVTDPSGYTLYVYDARGRVTSKAQSVVIGANTRSFTIGYGYAQGRPVSLTLPSGRVVAYAYNIAGQVSGITIDGASLLSNGEYFPFGGARKWTWANGQVYERTFDLDGRIKTVTLGPATAIYAELSQLFGYDSLSRLITATLAAGQTRGFGYDANSNRATATVNGTVTNYTYPASSHRLSGLSGANTKSFGYDDAGNTTQSGPVTLVYDGRGRLKQAGAATYLVNGAGQRVAKTIGASTTYFLYDEGGRLMGEYDSDGVAIQETVWLGTTPVATVRPKVPSGYDVFYVWADHLDTPRVVSDSLNVTRWSWEHSEPFGNYAADENPAGAGLFAYNLRFPGQYFDQEAGTHYNYFRDYDPSLGRYIQGDPIGLQGGPSLYAYAGANPLKHKDPLGLDYGFSVNPNAAGGNGHTTFYFQDRSGRWFSYDQGAAGATSSGEGNLGYLLGLNAPGGVDIREIDGLPPGASRFPSSRGMDGRITNCARISQEGHRAGNMEYNLYGNNCTDAAVNVLSCAGVDFYNPPFTTRPNSWLNEWNGKR